MPKNLILEKSCKIFLKYGFKSTTMDDIANKLAMSKKTIYKFFKNKESLVDKSVTYFHQTIYDQVNVICNKKFNAIEENFEIKKMFKDLLKNSGESPMFQLQKYYPKTFNKIMTKEFSMFSDCITQNIEKGITEGLYRPNIKVEIITKFYFALVYSVHDNNLFTYKMRTLNQLEIDVLEYHTRSIATAKGLKILEEQLEKFDL